MKSVDPRCLKPTDSRLHWDYYDELIPAKVIALLDEIERLQKERDDFHMDYRMKCDAETKELHEKVANLGQICILLIDDVLGLRKERDELRFGNLIKHGNTHPEMYKTELDVCKEQLAAAHAETDSVVFARDQAYAQLAACQKDAERYRWIRANHHGGIATQLLDSWNDIDGAIDEAMKGE